MNISVSGTVTSIKAALYDVKAVNCPLAPIFLSDEVVARPTFSYIYGLVKFFSQSKPSLCWTKLLFDDDNDLPKYFTKKGKLSFLIRIITVVSLISGYRFDIFVSPINILSGEDVVLTQKLLQALADCTISSNDMAEAVTYVLSEGDASLYKRGVKTRNSFRRLQAIFRGRRLRRQIQRESLMKAVFEPFEEIVANDSKEPFLMLKTDNILLLAESNGDSEVTCMESLPSDPPEKSLQSTPSEQNTKYQATGSEEKALLESYLAVISRKSKVEDELKLAEEKLKRKNDKLTRILHLTSLHKEKSLTPLSTELITNLRRPFSAPTTSVKGNFLEMHAVSKRLLPVDHAFAQNINDLSTIQHKVKEKLKRIEERERVLKQKIAYSKHKENELKLKEHRISDLADRIRRQQMQLTEHKLQFEQSKVTSADPICQTSRPCSLCSEKELHLREIKNKVKQRMRILRKRESDLIGRTQKLRMRESRLMELEHNVVATHKKIGGITVHLSPTRKDDLSKAVGSKKKNSDEEIQQSRPSGMNMEVSHADLIHNTHNLSKTSFRVCLDETVPTIEEESHNDSNDDDSDEKKLMKGHRHQHESPNKNLKQSIREALDKDMPISGNESFFVDTVFESKDLSQTSGGVAKRNKAFKKTAENGQLSTKTTESLMSPPKRRHVFTFEKKSNKEKIVRQNKSEAPLSDVQKIDLDQQIEAKLALEKHEYNSWISSFDVQMKCAMVRLKELI